MVVVPEDVSIVTTQRNQFNAWRRNNNKQGEEMKYDNTFLLLLGTKPRVTAISLFQSVTLILNVRMGVSMFCYSERRRKRKESQASHTQISTYPKSTKHLRKPITPQLCTTTSYTLSCPSSFSVLLQFCHTHRPFVVKGSKQGQQQKTT